MHFWWVNHNMTAQQEIEGGYLWSPKTMRHGGRSQFYENMRATRPEIELFLSLVPKLAIMER